MQQAENIRYLRRRAQMTQEQFAELFRVKRAAIQDIERGKTKLSAELAVKIAEHYGISLNWLLYGSGDMQDCAFVAEESLCYNESKNNPKIKEVVVIMSDLPIESQNAILEFAKDKKALNDMKKTVASLKKQAP